MNILILGSGAREHAFAWKMSQSDLCSHLYIAPGNAGTAQHGININININDFTAIKNCCLQHAIEMVFVGPEDPLVNGLCDFFKSDEVLSRIIFIGPDKEAAQLEGSKSYAKTFMQQNNIPTAAYKSFDNNNYVDGIEYIKSHSLPIVLKADGLAGGKGVLICEDHRQAVNEFELMVQQQKFGKASSTVVVEEFLNGIELSVFILTDGKNYLLLPEAKDYKRIGEGDTGLNTGGMGAISPVPFASETFMQKVITKIIEPTIAGLQKQHLDYKGFIFFGIIKVDDEPVVIEYNCRMGDPETEVVLPRIDNDLVKLFIATSQQSLDEEKILISKKYASTIVAVSGGYPGEYETNKKIELDYLKNPESKKHINKDGGAMVFHAATKREGDNVLTNGGRVLAVTALADTLPIAIELSKEILSKVYFENMYYRKDIGYEFID